MIMIDEKPIHFVIPVTFLKEAEVEYSDTASIIGSYVEAVQSDNWEHFYDKVGETLPDSGDLEDIFFDRKKNCIENFDILTDQITSAIAHIRHELDVIQLPVHQYEVINSKKLDGSSVIITLAQKTAPKVNYDEVYKDEKKSPTVLKR